MTLFWNFIGPLTFLLVTFFIFFDYLFLSQPNLLWTEKESIFTNLFTSKGTKNSVSKSKNVCVTLFGTRTHLLLCLIFFEWPFKPLFYNKLSYAYSYSKSGQTLSFWKYFPGQYERIVKYGWAMKVTKKGKEKMKHPCSVLNDNITVLFLFSIISEKKLKSFYFFSRHSKQKCNIL